MAFGKIKYLLRRIASDKVFRDRIFITASNSKLYGYYRELASMAYKFIDKNLETLPLIQKQELFMRINN